MTAVRKALRRGDLSHHGDSSYPVYAVICVDGGRAWLRDISSGVDSIVEIDKCQRLELAAARGLDIDLRRAVRLTPGPPNLKPD